MVLSQEPWFVKTGAWMSSLLHTPGSHDNIQRSLNEFLNLYQILLTY